ncbi:MAG: response regulator [Firmicutes bacterium]|nr:response regulator [Bacillota bacterium]
MINFIVVDDNVKVAKNVENIINKIMMKQRLEYKINIYDDYDPNFKKIMNINKSNKIYILDIETKSASGIDIARQIRKKDVESVIIFITAHEELGSVIIKENLLVLTFICKFDDFDNKLFNAINNALEIIGNKKTIRFNDYNSIYTIPLKDILYVTRDSIERKTIIKTEYANYKVMKSLTELKNISDGELIQTHKSCIVNMKRVLKIDKTRKIITFDNGDSIDLLSDNYKKGII